MTQTLPLKLHGTDTNPAQVQRLTCDPDGLILCSGMRVPRASQTTEWSPTRVTAGYYRWRDFQSLGWNYIHVTARGTITPIATEADAFAQVRSR